MPRHCGENLNRHTPRIRLSATVLVLWVCFRCCPGETPGLLSFMLKYCFRCDALDELVKPLDLPAVRVGKEGRSHGLEGTDQRKRKEWRGVEEMSIGERTWLEQGALAARRAIAGSALVISTWAKSPLVGSMVGARGPDMLP